MVVQTSGATDSGRGAGTSTSTAAVAVLLASTVFLSAFLLFQVQPIVGRLILPWFGGGATVWTTTLLFFQVALLCGYGYSHWIARRLLPRWQAMVHIALVVAAAAVLPIVPSEGLRPDSSGDPTLRILVVLAMTAGPPYLLLSTTGPLLQRWASAMWPSTSPYPLYALSNAGSLLALLSYPVLVEPLTGLRVQAWAWSAGYLTFAGATSLIAWRFASIQNTADPVSADPRKPSTGAPDAAASMPRVALWIALAACASAMLMATTNAMAQDLPSFPLLWVLPLAIYLVTFILAFGSDRVYEPIVFLFLFVAACIYGIYLLENPRLPLFWLALLNSGVLFVVCMVLHAEVARRRPHAAQLTTFYVALAGGGALGGLLVAVVAPAVFPDFWEYHLALFAAAVLAFVVRLPNPRTSHRSRGRVRILTWAGAIAVMAFGLVLAVQAGRSLDGALLVERSFYGVVRVYEETGQSTGLERRVMTHSGTLHGFQYAAPGMAQEPGAYYDRGSGAAIAIEALRGSEGRPLRIGVVGLGAGMQAALAEPGDEWTFIEIDPLVIEVAESQFTYLSAARERGASVVVREGDGRLVLEEALRNSAPGGYDVLVLDAFNGGSVPTHLLTAEAMEMYRAHLAPGGVIAVHVSNRHVRLTPVARAGADAAGLEAAYRDNPDGDGEQVIESQWVLAADGPAFGLLLAVAGHLSAWPDDDRVLWMDDHSDLWSVLTPF